LRFETGFSACRYGKAGLVGQPRKGGKSPIPAELRYRRTMERAQKPLWGCPVCGRAFANRSQRHACGRHALDLHFAGRSARVRAIYDAFVALLEESGPIVVLPEKTRIAFQVRMSFAQLTLRRNWVLGHFVLSRRVESPLFGRIESFSARNHLHAFRLDDPAEVAALAPFAREAYAVGRQDHLG
jgi:hypothetical protein